MTYRRRRAFCCYWLLRGVLVFVQYKAMGLSLARARALLLILALLGLMVSGYLLVVYVSGAQIVCGMGHGCDDVRASAYAWILGLPVPAYGVAYYFALGILAVLWSARNALSLRWPLAMLTAVGFVASMWLTYLEAFVIEAWCQWCVVSAVLATLAFVLVWGKLAVWK